MAKSQKQSGYDVVIKAFVPADLTDIEKLKIIQQKVDEARAVLAFVEVATITPTRR